MEALVDNDALLKIARYGLLSEFDRVLRKHGYKPPPRCVPLAKHSLGITGALNTKKYPTEGVRSDVRSFVLKCVPLKPSDCDPQVLKILSSVTNIDDGEAVLLAYAHAVPEALVFTGDKRCMIALANESRCASIVEVLRGRIVHFECALEAISNLIGWNHVRSKICADKDADGRLYEAVASNHHDSTARASLGSRIQSLLGDSAGLLHQAFH